MKNSQIKTVIVILCLTLGLVSILLTSGTKEPRLPKGKIPTHGYIYQPTQDFLA